MSAAAPASLGSLGLALLALACGPAPTEAPSPRAVAHDGTYAWRPGAEVPWLEGLAPEAIPFGELGRSPSTRLYLTFNGDLEEELRSQGARWDPAEPEHLAVPGRFGGGLALGELDAGFRPADGPPSRQWTLELWIRPERLRRGALVTLTGLFVARCDDEGHVILSAPGVPPAGDGDRVTVVKSPVPMRAGEWNHLAFVLDAEDTSSLRVVVNGEARGKALRHVPDTDVPPAVALGGLGRSERAHFDELRLQARAANTEELQEALRAPRPLERLRLTRSGSSALREVWFGVQRKPRLESAADWATGELERVVADAQGLRRVDAHWRRIEAPEPPVARTTHATAFLGNHRILVFGGETRDSHSPPMQTTDDTWIFDTRAESWQRLEPGTAPRGRCHQAAAYSPDHDLVLLGGGFEFVDGKPRQFGDTWVFRVGEGRWESCPGAESPFGFSDDGVVYHARKQVFVGVNQGRVRAFDPTRRVWHDLQPALVDEAGRALALTPAGSMSAGYDPRTGTILLVGGSRDAHDDAQYVDDVYLLDLDQNRMTRLDPVPRPSPRVRTALGWDARHERFVLFGGVRSQTSERMDDLWSFDPDARRWTRHESAGGPSPRGGYYGLEYDPELERFFLLCGRHSRDRFLAEAWTLALDERAPGRARYVFDRSAFPGETQWFADVVSSGDARVELRFRAGAALQALGPWSPDPGSPERYLEVELTLFPGSGGEVPRVRGLGFRAPG